MCQLGPLCHEEEGVLTTLLKKHDIRAVIHFAAESHVDRSIDGPSAFIESNVNGTLNLLQAVRSHWQQLPKERQDRFRMHHISTDEVYGSLGPEGLFTETTAYDPNSPYSASKASSDHFVRAYGETYGLPYVLTNCSNNYGPFHFPEKLIPLFITNLIEGKKVPLYGNGLNVRDWLHVDDHCRGIALALTKGRAGEIYNIGGGTELTNVELTHKILKAMGVGEEFIQPVEDRKGHDLRYSVDISKINKELGYSPQVNFEEGLEQTINWFKNNEAWWKKHKQSAPAIK